MRFHDVIEMTARGLELMGVAVVAVGVLAATTASARRAIANGLPASELASYRERLARATLLGLEFLVAADIVGTVTVAPSAAGLVMLAGIILLRTFLSATLVLEVEGRWPWATPRRDLER
jgi:uncharacterized membrane protein